MSHRPMFANHLKNLGRTVGTIALMEFVLKTRANISASQYVASSQQRSPQAILSHDFPSVHGVHAAPFQQSPPQAISHGFPSVHGVHTSISLRTELSPSYFPLPVSPSTHRFRLANGTLPRLFPTVFPSVHPVVPKLFPTVSCPSTLSSLPYRSPRGKVN